MMMEISEAAGAAAIAGHLQVMPKKKRRRSAAFEN
jgi:hypothetical protein